MAASSSAPSASASGVELRLATPQEVVLRRDALSGVLFAVDMRMFGNAIPVPPLDIDEDDWDCSLSASGLAYLSTDKRSVWFSDLVGINLYQNSAGRLFVQTKVDEASGERPTLPYYMDYSARHRIVQLTLHVPEFASEVAIDLAHFHTKQSGASVALSVNSLYDGAQLDVHPGTACKWFQKRIKGWRALAGSVGLHATTAVRLSLPWATNQPEQEASERCLTFNSFSPHAFIAIFAILASENAQRGGIKCEVAKAKAKRLLRAMLKLLPKSLAIQLSRGGDIDMIYGVGASGKDGVAVTAADSVVDVRPLAEANMRFDGGGGGVEFVSLEAFVQMAAVLRDDKAVKPLFKQLVWRLGTLLDQALVAPASAPNGDGGESAGEGESAVAVKATAILGGDRRHTVSELNKYMKASQRAMKGAIFLSMAPDGCKVGHSSYLLCPVANNDSGLVCWAPPQAVDEFLSEMTLVADDPSQEAEAASKVLAMSTAVVKRKAGESVDVGRPTKRPRRKAYLTMAAVDNILFRTTGAGLEQFGTKEEDGEAEKPALSWKFLSLAPDCGPDIFAAVAFMQYGPKALNVDVTFDLNHSNWNDIKMMYPDVKLWPHVLRMVSAMNLPFGSELSPDRLKQVKQAFADYQKASSPQSCSLFHRYLSDILTEAGTPERIGEEDIAPVVWESMQSDPVLNAMGQKVNLSRFMGVVYKGELDLKVWSKKAWVYTVASMQMGYESSAKVKKMVDSMRAAPAIGSSRLPDTRDEHKPTLKSSAQANQIRSVAENQLHVAAMMYGDEQSRITQTITLQATHQASLWHSKQNKALRDLESVQAFEQHEIRMGVNGMPRKMMGQLRDKASLMKCSIDISWSGRKLMDLQRPGFYGDLVDQQDRVDLYQRCIFSLTLRRAIRLLPLLRGWPRGFVLLLDPESRGPALATLKADFTAFQALKGLGHQWSDNITRRSVFQTPAVMQVVSVLRSEGWTCTKVVLDLIDARTRRIVCSQLTEDGIQRAKRGIEVSKNFVANAATIWGRLVDKEVLGAVHRFTEIDRSSEAAERGGTLPEEWHAANLTEASKRYDLKGILEEGGASPPWWSPQVTMLSLPIVDLVVGERLRQQRRMAMQQHTFFSQLVKSGTLLIKRREPENAPWYFALGCACGVAAVCWPAKLLETSDAGKRFEPAEGQTVGLPLLLEPIVDPQEWDAMVFEVESPTAAAVKRAPNGLADMSSWPRTLHMVTTGAPESLWRVAARNAYFDLPLTVLKQMVAHYELGSAATLLEHLCLLVQHALQADDQTLAGIVDGRIAFEEDSEHVSKIAELEEVADLMTKDEVDEAKRCATNFRRQKAMKQEMQQEFATKRKKLLNIPARVSANPRNERSPLFGRVYRPLPEDDASYDQPLAASMCPLGASIWEGRSNHTWQGHLRKGVPRVSFQWARYGGNRPAMLECLAKLWTGFLAEHGMSKSQCPIAGLPGF